MAIRVVCMGVGVVCTAIRVVCIGVGVACTAIRVVCLIIRVCCKAIMVSCVLILIFLQATKACCGTINVICLFVLWFCNGRASGSNKNTIYCYAAFQKLTGSFYRINDLKKNNPHFPGSNTAKFAVPFAGKGHNLVAENAFY